MVDRAGAAGGGTETDLDIIVIDDDDELVRLLYEHRRDGHSLGRRLEFVRTQFERSNLPLEIRLKLLRYQAFLTSSTDPDESVAACREIDQLTSSERRAEPPRAELMYLLMAGERSQAHERALEFCQRVGAGVTGPNLGEFATSEQLKFELHEDDSATRIGVLLRVIDVLRATGNRETAFEWLEVLQYYSPMARARRMSGLIARGHAERAVKLAKETVEVADARLELSEYHEFEQLVLQVESAQALLVAGHPGDADAAFKALPEHFPGFLDAKVASLCGQIDVCRRRRHLTRALDLGRQAEKETTGRSEILQADVASALGWVEIQLGNPRLGLEHCRRARELNRFDINAWVGEARALRVLGQHKLAIQLLKHLGVEMQSAWTTSSGQGEGYPNLAVQHKAILASELGWCFLDLNEWANAKQTFKASARDAPHLAANYRGLAAALAFEPIPLVLKETERLADEVDHHTAAAAGNTAEGQTRRKAPAVRDVYLEGARVLIRRRADREARAFVNFIFKDLSGPDRSTDAWLRVVYSLADAYLDARRIPEADEMIQIARSKHAEPAHEAGRVANDDRLALLESRLHLVRHAPRQAIAVLNEHRRRLPEDSRVAESFAMAEVVARFENRNFAEALDLLDKMHAKETHDSKVERSDLRRLLKAWIYLAESEVADSTVKSRTRVLRACGILKATDQTSTEELHLAAIIEARMHHIGKLHSLGSARQFIDRALSRRPNDSALLRDRAAILIASGDVDAAADNLELAQTLDPEDARIALLRGVVEFRSGAYHAAIRSFEQAATLDGRDHVHHRALAVANLAISNFDGAIRAIDNGLTQGSDQKARLELVRARAVALRAQTQPWRVAQASLIDLTERLAPIASTLIDPYGHPTPLGRDLAALQAYADASVGRHERARRRLRDARGSEIARQLKPQLVRRRDRLNELGAGALLLLSLAMAGGLVWLTNSTNRDDLSWTLIFIAASVVLVVFLMGVFYPRLTKVSVLDNSIELSSANPVDEIVHVDLDLSTSRLLLVSGFSNHRPTLPSEETLGSGSSM